MTDPRLSDPNLRRRAGLGIPEFTQAGRYHPLERVVRPWVDVASTPKAPREPVVPDVVRPEAFIEWGAASEFASDTFRSDAKNVGFKVNDNDEPERVRHVFSEEGRTWTDFKVISPIDPDSYIIERMATQLALNGPGGDQFRIILKPDPPGDKTGQGQTPPSPPLSDME